MTVPAIFVVPSFTVKVDVVTVEGFIFSVNVDRMLEVTPVARLAGVVLTTVGLTVSAVILPAVEAAEVLPTASLTFIAIL